jgi:CubicO group peptidase (beta-lactamase class C family)
MRVLWVIAVAGCAERADFSDPIGEDGLPRGQASAEAAARYGSAADWSEEHGGLAFLVVEGDEVVFERYAEGYDPLTPVHLFSGTKSFSCALVQAAIANGDVTSLEERVSDVLPALDTDEKRDITVRQLLDFTSGLEEDPWDLTIDGLREEQRVEDKAAHAAARPLESAPGEAFHYGGAHLWTLSGWFLARTGRDPVDYLDEHVFGPIGFAYGGWIRDPAGNPALPYGAWTTAGQWAKYGILARDDGDWAGAAVLPAGAIAECVVGSEANPAYGLTWWLNRETDAELDPVGRTVADEGPILYPDGPDDLFGAAGAHDQRLYVIPSLDLVIVRLGTGDRAFREEELVARALDGADPPGGCAHTGGRGPGALGGLSLLVAASARKRRGSV